MTDEQINAAIAEACGRRQKLNGEWFPDNGLTVGSQGIPNYCNDLNAMHKAEQYLESSQWYDYALALNEVCWHWALIHAPARQRAEAFLRTLGKWEEVQG